MPDGTPPNADVIVTIPIRKVDKEQRIVYGIVLEPGSPDSTDAHGDWVSTKVIEEAAHSFMSRYRRQSKLGVQHSIFGENGLDLVESYIAPVDFVLGGQSVAAGSWVMATKVTTDSLWEDVMGGKFTGYSIGAVATVLNTTADS